MAQSAPLGIWSFLRANRPWLAAGALLTLLSSFGQTFFISLFARQIQSDFGLSHGAWGGIYAVGTMVSAATMVWAGGLTDRWRARSLGSTVLILLASACLFMAINPFAALLPVVIFALRLTGQGMLSHIAVVAMGRWFQAARGRALATATLGFSVGEAALPVIFVGLMTFIDWRWLWVLAALLSLAAIPALRRLLKEERTPQSIAKDPRGSGMCNRNWSRGQALRHSLFWFAVPTLIGPSTFGTAFFFHQVHFATSKGWEHIALVGLFPLYTFISIAAMFLSGIVLDRFGTARMMPVILVPIVFAFLCFGLGDRLWFTALGFVFFALTTGAYATTSNAFWAEFYGTTHLGAIKAVGAAVMVLGSAIGPGLTGFLIDLGVALDTQYAWVAAYFVFAATMMAVGVARVRKDLPAFA